MIHWNSHYCSQKKKNLFLPLFYMYEILLQHNSDQFIFYISMTKRSGERLFTSWIDQDSSETIWSIAVKCISNIKFCKTGVILGAIFEIRFVTWEIKVDDFMIIPRIIWICYVKVTTINWFAKPRWTMIVSSNSFQLFKHFTTNNITKAIPLMVNVHHMLLAITKSYGKLEKLILFLQL